MLGPIMKPNVREVGCDPCHRCGGSGMIRTPGDDGVGVWDDCDACGGTGGKSVVVAEHIGAKPAGGQRYVI